MTRSDWTAFLIATVILAGCGRAVRPPVHVPAVDLLASPHRLETVLNRLPPPRLPATDDPITNRSQVSRTSMANVITRAPPRGFDVAKVLDTFDTTNRRTLGRHELFAQGDVIEVSFQRDADDESPLVIRNRDSLRIVIESPRWIGSWSRDATVGVDGTVVVEPFGVVPAAGHTVHEFSRLLSEAMEQKNPGSRVRVTFALRPLLERLPPCPEKFRRDYRVTNEGTMIDVAPFGIIQVQGQSIHSVETELRHRANRIFPRRSFQLRVSAVRSASASSAE